MKKTLIPAIIIIICCFFSAFSLNPALAQEKIEINFFYSPTCPHCTKENKFLDELEKKYSEIDVKRFEISKNTDLVKEFYEKYAVPEKFWGLTPATFIDEKLCDKYFIGFDEKRTGHEIENYLQQFLQSTCENQNQIDQNLNKRVEGLKDMSLPLIGKINISETPLLALTATIGILDGFNACAMVALGFLLAVLISSGIRKRVFWIGGTFILTSGIVYFIFISAWLNIFLFLGYLKIITIAASLVIIFFSVFLLKDYFSGIVCRICGISKEKEGILTKWEKRLLIRMEKLAAVEMPLLMTLFGVFLVAIGINTIELVCSLGFPLAYTKILTSYGLSAFSYYGHILLYVIFYMLDDFLIFAIAIITLRVAGVSDKYLKAIKLISGAILLLLGLIMLIKPQLLIF